MREIIVAGTTAIMLWASPAMPDEAATVLRVSGGVEGGVAEFDAAALRALPQTTLVTSTVVTDGTHSFTGVLARDLLDQIGASGDHVTATALNDYAVDIPMTDFRDYDVIIAHSMDGAPLDRADKGPLWIVYPRDDHAVLQDIRYDYRWVWQLSGLDIR